MAAAERSRVGCGPAEAPPPQPVLSRARRWPFLRLLDPGRDKIGVLVHLHAGQPGTAKRPERLATVTQQPTWWRRGHAVKRTLEQLPSIQRNRCLLVAAWLPERRYRREELRLAVLFRVHSHEVGCSHVGSAQQLALCKHTQK